ncbi:MAG: aldo/keto reductase [Sandaracinaceae bacterium]
MDTRPLGRSDLRLSQIALGTWGLTENSYGHVDAVRLRETLDTALERGITTFDCAPLWGDGASERAVAEALERAGVQGVVITRGGVRRVDGVLRRSFTQGALVADAEESLRRLGRETIDLWLLHNPGLTALRRDDWREAVHDLEASGKVRHWGIAIGEAEEARIALSAGAQAVCLTHNLLAPGMLKELLSDLEAHGAGVIVRSPLAYGLLGGHWQEGHTFAEDDHRSRRWDASALRQRVRHVGVLRFLVGRGHPDLATAAIRFALTSRQVSTVAVGCRSPYQVSAAVAAPGTPIEDEDLRRLAELRTSAQF